MRLHQCCNFHDFRKLAWRRLPAPIFNYIDGAADDEVTYRRNTESFERCDLVPNVLRGVGTVDMSVTVMGARAASNSAEPAPSAEIKITCAGAAHTNMDDSASHHDEKPKS